MKFNHFTLRFVVIKQVAINVQIQSKHEMIDENCMENVHNIGPTKNLFTIQSNLNANANRL